MLRFVDGFENIGSILEKWDVSTAGNQAFIAGRFSGSSWRCNFTGGQGVITRILDAQPTWIVGMAFKIRTNNTARDFLHFYDGSTLHVNVGVNSSGKLVVSRNGTLLGTGTTVLNVDTWYYLEAKVTIHDTTGEATIRLDGATEISLANQDTRNGGNASADRISLVHPGTGGLDPVTNYDDVYVCDATGSANNDFLGDCRIIAILPNGDGATSNLVGSDGNSTSNYLLVDEADPNDDTDYVESSTVGDKDTYAFANTGVSVGTVKGVQVNLNARKTDVSTRSVRALARLSGTEIESGDFTLGAAYAPLRAVFETKPGGGSWSFSDVDSAEFGVKVSA